MNLSTDLYIYFLSILSFIIFSCSCNSDIEGKYYCYNVENSVSYVEFFSNGTFRHFFKKDGNNKSFTGKWKMNEKGYCRIELSAWRLYNNGEDYKEYDNWIFFINGDYLDDTPDGNTSSSYVKK